MPKRKINQAFTAALARVELAEQRIVALHFALHAVRRHGQLAGEAAREFSALHAELYRHKADAISDVFMWALVAGEEQQREARKLAFRTFLTERSSIMRYLDATGLYPGQWSAAEEEEFRAEIEAERVRG